MKVALAQLHVIPGQPERNFLRMSEMVLDAKKQGADLIIFPEMAVGGYLLGDRWLDEDWCRYLDSFNEKIKSLSQGIGIIWGNIHFHPLNSLSIGRDGRPVRLNAGFFAYNNLYVERENHQFPGLYIKHLNPDYRFFDDSRYFLSGLEVKTHQNWTYSPFLTPFIWTHQGHTTRIGLEVCEDLWSDDYSTNITSEIIKNRAELIVNISSSPWTLRKEEARHRHISKKAQVPLIYVNAVSMQNNGKNVVILDGDSSAYSSNGIRIASCNDRFKEELLLTDLSTPHLPSYSGSKLLDGLLFAIRQFDSTILGGKSPWIIGLSGGIDSSLAATLLVEALGPKRVIGYNLATHYNSSKTKTNAAALAHSLGIQYYEGSISALVDGTESTLLKEFNFSSVDSFSMENIQARIRGHLLTSFASLHHGVVCNNGNKVEIALGYCTLYGDTIGALAPLGDLTKIQIIDLAKTLNALHQKEIIPLNVIPSLSQNHSFSWDVAPSAELKSNQVDPMKWGYHDALLTILMTFPTRRIEKIMEDYLYHRLDDTLTPWLPIYGLDQPAKFIEDLEWFMNAFQKGIFKRIQMPPIVAISRGAFGFDYRESQMIFEPTQNYRELKEKILAKNKY